MYFLTTFWEVKKEAAETEKDGAFGKDIDSLKKQA